MPGLTPEGQHMVETMAARHQVGRDAATHVLLAIAAGGGSQAQFNHPDLGGMGQWSRGGMIMVGDMFNTALKYRVDALCNDLADALGQATPLVAVPPAQSSDDRWPADLGVPSSTGSQNAMAYAVFPASRRLATARAGQITIHDTGDHRIGGVAQQQGGDQTLTFTSQYGLVPLHDLPIVVAPPSGPPPVAAPAATDDAAIFDRLERLAELCRKGVITQDEFAAKKAELLARL